MSEVVRDVRGPEALGGIEVGQRRKLGDVGRQSRRRWCCRDQGGDRAEEAGCEQGGPGHAESDASKARCSTVFMQAMSPCFIRSLRESRDICSTRTYR